MSDGLEPESRLVLRWGLLTAVEDFAVVCPGCSRVFEVQGAFLPHHVDAASGEVCIATKQFLPTPTGNPNGTRGLGA